MSIVMDEKEMKALAAQLAKYIKTEKDPGNFSRIVQALLLDIIIQIPRAPLA